ncbi:MAG: hypothetical protein Q9159_001757 [Coniocarpon cinnabarinum]
MPLSRSVNTDSQMFKLLSLGLHISHDLPNCLNLHNTTTAKASPPPGLAQPTPLRNQLKDTQHAKNAGNVYSQHIDGWDLRVGLEIHAELSTSHKLFSSAAPTVTSAPNTHATAFDTAIPGAQPKFQSGVLLPALRAALALKCDIQARSAWDRKHYFWWDQPQGYQITQYYEPFAKNGHVALYPWDDPDPVDILFEPNGISIGVKQVQMEQDTAKTTLQPPDLHLLDFNRAGLPLVEIITRPEIKSPKTAAAVVRKIQALLQSVGANSTGMELGGLRADVNVSVRRKGQRGPMEYAGVTDLGQRTEIKNLSSFKAVEDAIVAERDRQIGVLEAGGVIVGETRGWTLGTSNTRRLRGKEGEVDYRYMPDPDLEPLRIGQDLVTHVLLSMPTRPDDAFKQLTTVDVSHGLSVKDAKTLISLDDGERLEFYLDTLRHIDMLLCESEVKAADTAKRVSKTVSNWVLMEIPNFISAHSLPFPYKYDLHASTSNLDPELVMSTPLLAAIAIRLLRGGITQQSARALLPHCTFLSDPESRSPQAKNETTMQARAGAAQILVDRLIAEQNFWVQPVDEELYVGIARDVITVNQEMAQKAKDELSKTQGKKRGKLMWLVGQMAKRGKEKGQKVELKEAERFITDALFPPDDTT